MIAAADLAPPSDCGREAPVPVDTTASGFPFSGASIAAGPLLPKEDFCAGDGPLSDLLKDGYETALIPPTPRAVSPSVAPSVFPSAWGFRFYGGDAGSQKVTFHLLWYDKGHEASRVAFNQTTCAAHSYPTRKTNGLSGIKGASEFQH
jgi:hypothetical protein